jgi:hypothetical protein
MVSICISPCENIFCSSAGGIITREPLVLDGIGVRISIVACKLGEGVKTKFVFAIPTTWMFAAKQPQEFLSAPEEEETLSEVTTPVVSSGNHSHF